MNSAPGTIYIELENPRDLWIATRMKNAERYRAYQMDEVKYGRDVVDDIEDSDQFYELSVHEVELLVGDLYEWPERYKPRFAKAWIHKT